MQLYKPRGGNTTTAAPPPSMQPSPRARPTGFRPPATYYGQVFSGPSDRRAYRPPTPRPPSPQQNGGMPGAAQPVPAPSQGTPYDGGAGYTGGTYGGTPYNPGAAQPIGGPSMGTPYNPSQQPMLSDAQMQDINRQRWDHWKQANPRAYDANGRLLLADAGPTTLSRGPDGRIYDKPRMLPGYGDEYLWNSGATQPPQQPSAAQPVPAPSQGTQYGAQIGGWPDGLQPFTAQYKNFDGTMSDQPNFGQRDAFISQLNNQLGQMQSQSWDKPGMGAPQFNFPSMWNQAGKMVQQGWQNPFTMR